VLVEIRTRTYGQAQISSSILFASWLAEGSLTATVSQTSLIARTPDGFTHGRVYL